MTESLDRPNMRRPAAASGEPPLPKKVTRSRRQPEDERMTMTTVQYRDIERHVGTGDAHVSASLPPDTVAQGVRRLGWLALVYAIGNITGLFVRLLLAAGEGRSRHPSSVFGSPVPARGTRAHCSRNSAPQTRRPFPFGSSSSPRPPRVKTHVPCAATHRRRPVTAADAFAHNSDPGGNGPCFPKDWLRDRKAARR